MWHQRQGDFRANPSPEKGSGVQGLSASMSGRSLRRNKNQAKTQATTAEELKRLRESQINFPYRAGDPRYHYCTAQG